MRPISAGLSALFLAVCVAAIALPLELRAQQTEPPAETESDTALEPSEPARTAPGEVEEILVTGARSDVTDVQDEAQAVTAFSMRDLDRANVVDVESLAFSVPSLHVGQLGNQVIVTLRGIGTQNASPSGEPGVAHHVDGVNFVRPASAQVAFFDLEGVQVLRGPQGTKGGKNANSGAINVISRKPNDEYEFTADIQVGSFEERRVRMALNLPVSEYLQLRTAGIYHDRLGYIENELLDDDDRDPFDADDFGLRQHLLFRPSESLESLLTYNFYRQDGNGTQAKLIPLLTDQVTDCGVSRLPKGPSCFTVDEIEDFVINGPNGPVTITRPNGRSFLLSGDDSLLAEPGKIQTDFPSSRDNRFWGFTSTTTWETPALPLIGGTRLKAISSYQRIELENTRDFDATNQPLGNLSLAEDTDQISAELQWSSSAGETVDWQLSGFFLHQQSDQNFRFQTLDERNVTTGELLFQDLIGIQDTENKSYGLAVHTDWHLNDAVTVSSGLRYSKEVRRLDIIRETTGLDVSGLDLEHCAGGESDTEHNLIPDEQVPVPSFPLPDENGNLFEPIPIPKCTQTFRHVNGGVNVEWRPLEDHLFYLRADRGFKGGGFSNLGFGRYDPEFIWAYALGAKNSFFDERLEFSAEAYFYDYKDLQIVNLDGLELRTENADVEIFGVDFEAKAQPIAGLDLNVAVGYLHSNVTDFFSIDPTDEKKGVAQKRCELDPTPGRFSCPTLDDYSGNVVSRAPEWTLTLGAEYAFFLGNWGSLTPRIQYYWQDDTYYRIYNEPRDLQEAYHITDLKLTWRDTEERWLIEGFVGNLEDDFIYQNVVIGPRTVGSPPNAWYSAPRTWGMRVGFRY